MFLSRMVFSHLPAVAGLAVAAAALLVAAEPAAAQQYGSKTWPANVKGLGQVVSAPSTPPAGYTSPSAQRTAPFTAINVRVSRRTTSPYYVTLRGPDGTVRTFRLEGGPETVQTREVTVRAGERLVINLATPTQPQLRPQR